MADKIYESIIVGGGIAGFEAALALKNFRHDFLWIGGKRFGEKLFVSEWVQNFPSFSGSGKELAALLAKQAEREELPFLAGRIDGIYAMGETFLLAQAQESFSSRTVILATGVEVAGEIEGEREYFGRGVSYCAVCDGGLYKDKTVAAVLSSGEFADEAEYLAGFAKKVYAVCRFRDPHFRAENIETVTDRPLRVEGGARVERLCFRDRALPVDGVFFLKNSAPPSALVGGLETLPDGHVKIGRDCATNLKGLFAAGDITGKPYQFVKAAGEGLVAAYSVHDYLKTL